jgi:hypothetical protein
MQGLFCPNASSYSALIDLYRNARRRGGENAKEDTVEVHGKSLQLSCAEWKRNQDGSWTSTGPLLVGTDTLTNVTLRGAKETNVLEAKCANGSSPSATPSRSDDATRHARHGHRHAEPTDGT